MRRRDREEMAELIDLCRTVIDTIRSERTARLLESERYDVEMGALRRRVDDLDAALGRGADMIDDLRRNALSIERTLNERTAHLA